MQINHKMLKLGHSHVYLVLNNTQKQGVKLRQEAAKGLLGHRVKQSIINVVNPAVRMCNSIKV